MKNRFLSVILVLCLCMSLLPTAAFAEGETHTDHCVCGGSVTMGNHSCDGSTAWAAWNETASLPSSGSYYLTQDVLLTTSHTIASGTALNLCLNGHTVTYQNTSSYYEIKGTLNLCDCSTVERTYTRENYKLTGGAVMSSSDGLYLNDSNAALTLYSGNVVGCGETGVYVGKGSFTMYGGEIVGCKDRGVYTTTNGFFTMHGGSIHHNSSNQNSAGVYASTSFTMTGGSITNNNSSNSSGYVGGVYFNSSLTLSGSPVIEDNTINGNAGNLYLKKEVTIGTNGLTAGASIGVTAQISYSGPSEADITNSNAADYSSYFFADDPNTYHIENTGEETFQVVKLAVGPASTPHEHSWTYTAKDKDDDYGQETIVATCNGDGTCDATNTELTIIAPLHEQVNDGKTPEAAFANNATSVGGEDTLPAIMYQQTATSYPYDPIGAPTETPPTGAGRFEASITVEGVKASVVYIIKKLDRESIKQFAVSDITNNSFVITLDEADRGKTDFVCEIASDYIGFTPDENGKATITVPEAYAGSGNLWVYVYQKETDTHKKSNTKDTTVSLLPATPTPAETPVIGTDLSTSEVTYDKDAAATALSITASVTDGGTLNYQWYKNDTASTDGAQAIDGETGASYTPATSAAGTTYYYCVITNTKDGQTATTISAIAKITVNEPAPTTYTVTVTDDGNGTASASPTTAVAGTEITLTAIPATGYQFKEWQVVEGGVTVTVNKFTMPSANVKIKAVFEADTPAPAQNYQYTNESGSTAYAETLLAAMQNAESGTTIKVLTNCADDSEIYLGSDGQTSGALGDKTLTLDLNGKLVSGEGGIQLLSSGAKLTFMDSSSGGSYSGTIISAGGELTVSTVKIDGYVQIMGGSLTVNSGEIKTLMVLTGTNIILNGGTFSDTTNAIIVYDVDGESTADSAKEGLKELPGSGMKYSKEDSDIVTDEDSGVYYAYLPGPVSVIPEQAIATEGVVDNTAAGSFNGTTATGLDTIVNALKADPANNGKDIEIKLTVTENTEQTAPTIDVTAIKTVSGDKTLQYLDLKLTQKIGDGEATDIGDSNTQLLTITIPFEKGNKQNITVFRCHETQAEALSENPPADAEGFVVGSDSITIYAKKFSTYAVGYTLDDTYTITLNANGGTINGSTTLVTGTDGKLSSLPTPTHGGSYSFKGWYTAANGGTQVTTATAFTENTTIYAQWTYTGGSGVYYPTTYTVVVGDADNAEVSASVTAASKGTIVTIQVAPNKGYTLETLTATDRSGKEIELTKVGEGKYTFKMPASKVTVQATFMEDNTMLNFFVDVPVDTYYYDAVLWAAKNGITEGTSATTFSPDMDCSRAQMVTFLWRTVGSPEPTTDVCPFTDVDLDSYYGKAVLWAVENGITKGTSTTTFSPDMACSRAQMVTFICRMAGGKPMSSIIAFTDVSADAYYAESVQWAVENGITNGTGDNKFSPDATCTRAQMVTFLYRYFVK